MAESVEYQVLVRHTVDLQLAVKDNLTHLGARLITAQIITLDQYREIRNPHRPVNERGADLVGYIQNKVRQDPQHYHTFISALRSDLSQYDDISTKLEDTRLSVASERQPVIPQLPTPRGDGSQLSVQDNIVQRINRLETRFRGHLQKLMSEVTIKRLPVDAFYQALATLPFAFSMEYERPIQQLLPAAKEIDGQSAINSSIFLLFNPLFAFIDYDLLDHMITKFGSAELKSEMALYIKDIKIFMRETTVGDLIDYWPGREVTDLNYVKLKAKFRDDPMTYTLERLNRFRRRFCSKVRLSELICCITSAESTESFIIIWIIPAAIIPELSEAIQRLDKSFFEQEHIISIFVNQKQIYPFTHLSIATAARRISHAEKESKFGDPYNVKPGLCVIINNTDFKNGKNLKGGDKDEQDLLQLFFSLRFKVKIHRNLMANEMVHKLESYSKRQHTGAFVLIILSHSTVVREREAIVGTDGKTVMINDIESFFHTTKCPTLREIPKIFLIDACRVDQQERVYSEYRSHDTSRLIPESADPNSRNRRAAKLESDTSDFLLVYASTHRHVANSTSRGGQLTRTFIEVTKEAADDKTITKIIQEVKARVQERGQQTVESVNTLTHDYFMKRNTRMRGLEELPSELRTRVEEWIPVRKKTIQKIESIIDDLKKHHKNVNISRITGSSVSITGSLIAILGFGLAPVTLGASIGLSAAGIAMAVAGGGTAAGASIADAVLQKLNVKQAQEHLKEDYNQLYMIQVIAKVIDSNTAVATGAREEYPGVDNRVVGEVLGQSFLRASTVGFRTAEIAATSTLEVGAAALRVGGTAARSVAAAGLVLNVVLIPIDLIEIVRSSISLARGSQTKAVKKLIEIVEQLNQQLRELRSIIYQRN